MLNKIKKSLKNNKGFTLIELIIVIAVVVLLAAITIPTYTNVISSAKDAEVTSAARNAYLAVMVDYTEGLVDVASGAETDMPSSDALKTAAEEAIGVTSENGISVSVTPGNNSGEYIVTVTINGRKATASASGVTAVENANT